MDTTQIALDQIDTEVKRIVQSTQYGIAREASVVLSQNHARLLPTICQQLVNVVTRVPNGENVPEARWILQRTNGLSRPLRKQLARYILRYGDAHMQGATLDDCRHNLSYWHRIRLAL